ncbi:hypothetical protein V1512DRAFT_261136 [Lipomyces arxii]|uniref:uncharacterized protein n=1 Tax=Lipomyces arxii TaxID=56418 RepID=UPI0034CF7FE6
MNMEVNRINVDKDLLMDRMKVGQGAIKTAARPGSIRKRRKSSSESVSSVEQVPDSEYDGESVQDEKSEYKPEGEAAVYLPIVFALCPAFVGMVFDGGSQAVTDLLLLSIMGLYLHWLVKAPYEWYRDARVHAVRLEMYPCTYDEERVRVTRERAISNLARTELASVFACFLGPLAGGVMLHVVRGQLRSGGSGLVSDFNITLFVLSAGVRGVLVASEYVQHRTSVLHQVVRTQPLSKVEILELKMQNLELRVDGVEDEHALDEPHLRSDVDALTRTMRRYERQQAEMMAFFNGKLHDLDSKLDRHPTRTGGSNNASVKSVYPSSLFTRKKYGSIQNLVGLISWGIYLPWTTVMRVLGVPSWLFSKMRL